MRFLVTGSKGQLGYDCLRELKRRGFFDVLGIDKDELDITDENAVYDLINKYKPDVVIHNAAWTAVDKAEENIEIVKQVNSLGPLYIAKACKNIGAKMVYISTDYVFDGKGDKFFEVDDSTNGLSVYGRTKLEGEKYVKNTIDNYYIIRISWVFGVNGNNFVKTMIKLSDLNKKQISVVCDQIGSPTYTVDLAKLIVDMVQTTKYGVYHATNEGVCSWYEFAKYILESINSQSKVIPVTTSEYLKANPAQANRPLNSRLSKKKLDSAGFSRLPNWKNAIDRYLKELHRL